MNDTALVLQTKVVRAYIDLFGPTSLISRLKDIKEEADELYYYYNDENLKEELSDLIATCFALATERGWSIDELIQMNLNKIAERKANGHYERTGEARTREAS